MSHEAVCSKESKGTEAIKNGAGQHTLPILRRLTADLMPEATSFPKILGKYRAYSLRAGVGDPTGNIAPST